MITLDQFKDLFLKLTEYTIPYGKEYTIEKYLPNGFKQDDIGNYYYEIGNSTTLFTTHLDTICSSYKKVVHMVDAKNKYIISTNGKTTLGGDNKLGTAILISMINEGIEGTYYFFVGEEGGCIGSRFALSENMDYFKKFKRAVAFDRREYGSIVTRQKGRNCCSQEFASAIAESLSLFSNGSIGWDKKSEFGYWTDTAVFMDTIREVTNLSVGGFKEHTKKEWANLLYTYDVLNVAVQLDWESLPTVREIPPIDEYEVFAETKIESARIELVSKIMGKCDFILTKKRKVGNEIELKFSKLLEDVDIMVLLKDKLIYIDGIEMKLNQIFPYFKRKIMEQGGTVKNYLNWFIPDFV